MLYRIRQREEEEETVKVLVYVGASGGNKKNKSLKFSAQPTLFPCLLRLLLCGYPCHHFRLAASLNATSSCWSFTNASSQPAHTPCVCVGSTSNCCFRDLQRVGGVCGGGANGMNRAPVALLLYTSFCSTSTKQRASDRALILSLKPSTDPCENISSDCEGLKNNKKKYPQKF